MSESETLSPGVLDGLSRLLRELLRTPRWRETIRIFLRDLDPAEAGKLAGMLWEVDPELFLALLAALPSFANAGIETAHTVAKHLMEMPPELAKEFTVNLKKDFDAGKAGEVIAMCLALNLRLQQENDSTMKVAAETVGSRFMNGFQKGMTLAETEVISWSQCLEKVSGSLTDFARKQPDVAAGIVMAVRSFAAVVDEQAKGVGGDGNTK